MRTTEGLAQARFLQGRTDEARDLFAQALAGRLRNDGPDGFRTLLCRRRFARFLLAVGDLKGARRELTATIAAYDRAYEIGHPLRYRAQVDLAELLLREGDDNAARALLQEAVPIMDRVFGVDHPASCRARELLARAG